MVLSVFALISIKQISPNEMKGQKMRVIETSREERGDLILHRILHRDRIGGRDTIHRILIVQDGMKFAGADFFTEVPDAFSPDINIDKL